MSKKRNISKKISNKQSELNRLKPTPHSPDIKKQFHLKDLLPIRPKTPAQKSLFQFWSDNFDLHKSMVLYGSAGTGKTFCGLYLGLIDVLNENSEYDKVTIIRSIVPTRDIGFLPGEIDEKISVYEEPYRGIVSQFFPWKKAYDNLKLLGKIEFIPTSFLRGNTIDNSVIVVDEFQNMTFAELDTIITRVGQNSKIIFCGDVSQSDLNYKKTDTSGFTQFMNILERVGGDHFFLLKFGHEDIIRSGLVREYIIAKERI